MNSKDKAVADAIKEALAKGEAMFYAMNTLALVTRVNFTGLDMEWYNAKDFLEGWLEKMNKED